MGKFKKFYLDIESADVHFWLDQHSTVPAHKVLLAAESDVFNSMFYGPMKIDRYINIAEDNVPIVAVMEFLKYFYFEDTKPSVEYIDHVLYLGRKYLVEKCVNGCMAIYNELLDNESACDILDRVLLYDIEEMIKICSNHISVNTLAVFNSAQFIECSEKALEHILKLNLLSVPKSKCSSQL